jgi:RNA polymerase sigma factor for flagellar operon FliA
MGGLTLGVASAGTSRETPNEGGGHVGSMSRAVSATPEKVEQGINWLWSEFKQTGERTVRNELIEHYSPFVKYVAGRVMAGLPRHFDEDDLISYGIIGLIDAIDRFEPDRNLRFETYAIPRIKGAIIDELRSIDWVPRSVRSKARAVEQAVTQLEATLRRSPTDAEVATELQMTSAEFHAALRKISSTGMMALDEVLRGSDRSDRSTLGESLPDRSFGPVDTFEAKESKQALLSAVEDMPERERTVLTMYYYGGLTLTEIGAILGVTESRVCQIHTKALRHLRSKLEDNPNGTDARADRTAMTTSTERTHSTRTGRTTRSATLELLAS